jgi:hypothetical protein
MHITAATALDKNRLSVPGGTFFTPSTTCERIQRHRTANSTLKVWYRADYDFWCTRISGHNFNAAKSIQQLSLVAGHQTAAMSRVKFNNDVLVVQSDEATGHASGSSMERLKANSNGDTGASTSGRPKTTKGERARFQALAAAAAASSDGLPPLLNPDASVDDLLAEGGGLLAASAHAASGGLSVASVAGSGAAALVSTASAVAASRGERYRTTSGSEVGLELDPHRAKVVEVYGFVGWVVTYAALAAYILWAYLPESVLHNIGVTYYPDRYWALAAPAMLLSLVMTYASIYGLIGLVSNPHVDSFDSLSDGYSKHFVLPAPSAAAAAAAAPGPPGALRSGAAAGGAASSAAAAVAAATARVHSRWGTLAQQQMAAWRAQCRRQIVLNAAAAAGAGSATHLAAAGLLFGGSAASAAARAGKRVSAGEGVPFSLDGLVGDPDAFIVPAGGGAALRSGGGLSPTASAAVGTPSQGGSSRVRGTSCPPLDRLASHVAVSDGPLAALLQGKSELAEGGDASGSGAAAGRRRNGGGRGSLPGDVSGGGGSRGSAAVGLSRGGSTASSSGSDELSPQHRAAAAQPRATFAQQWEAAHPLQQQQQQHASPTLQGAAPAAAAGGPGSATRPGPRARAGSGTALLGASSAATGAGGVAGWPRRRGGGVVGGLGAGGGGVTAAALAQRAAAAKAAAQWLPSGVSKLMGTPDIADLPATVINRLQFFAPLALRAGGRRLQRQAGTAAGRAPPGGGGVSISSGEAR